MDDSEKRAVIGALLLCHECSHRRAVSCLPRPDTWLTGTGVSAARAYWESARAKALAGGQTPPPVTVPVAFSAFPGEIFQAPRSWVQNAYPTLTYYNKPARGGHFAAWEEPELFATELRAAFRSLR